MGCSCEAFPAPSLCTGASWLRGEVSLELALQLTPAPRTCPGHGSGHPRVWRLCQEPGATRGRAQPEQDGTPSAHAGVRRVGGTAHPSAPHTGTCLPLRQENCLWLKTTAEQSLELAATSSQGQGGGKAPPAQPTPGMAGDGSLSAENRTPVWLRLLRAPQFLALLTVLVGQVSKDLGAQWRVPGEPMMLAGPQVVRNNWFF